MVGHYKSGMRYQKLLRHNEVAAHSTAFISFLATVFTLTALDMRFFWWWGFALGPYVDNVVDD